MMLFPSPHMRHHTFPMTFRLPLLFCLPSLPLSNNCHDRSNSAIFTTESARDVKAKLYKLFWPQTYKRQNCENYKTLVQLRRLNDEDWYGRRIASRERGYSWNIFVNKRQRKLHLGKQSLAVIIKTDLSIIGFNIWFELLESRDCGNDLLTPYRRRFI
jgi:hypothetical protein